MNVIQQNLNQFACLENLRYNKTTYKRIVTEPNQILLCKEKISDKHSVDIVTTNV